MNDKKYILVDRNALMLAINTLRKIDDVHGFDNMDRLVGCVDALQKIVLNSPALNPPVANENPVMVDPELEAAAEAAKAEEEARRK